MTGTADLSPCGRYRYLLTRTWAPGLPRVAWLMCNPSTADASRDDPTIRRVSAFSRAWGCGHVAVVNLSPYRSSHPADAWRHPLPPEVHETNLGVVDREAARAELVIAAWGVAGARLLSRDPAIAELIAGLPLHHLGLTTQGHPKHPLARGSHRIPEGRRPERLSTSEEPRSAG